MTYDVNVGCCAQMDINGTTINSTATDRSFAFMGAGTAKPGLNNKNTQTLIANWAKANGICGPTASMPWVVGWDLYSPIRVKYFKLRRRHLGYQAAQPVPSFIAKHHHAMVMPAAWQAY